jgi:hypothetical protein
MGLAETQGCREADSQGCLNRIELDQRDVLHTLANATNLVGSIGSFSGFEALLNGYKMGGGLEKDGSGPIGVCCVRFAQ